jgi:hypothetical protein
MQEIRVVLAVDVDADVSSAAGLHLMCHSTTIDLSKKE